VPEDEQAFVVVEHLIVVRKALIVSNPLNASMTDIVDFKIRSVISDSIAPSFFSVRMYSPTRL
jgi:hypothetical protein